MQQPSSRSRSDHVSLARLFKAGSPNAYPFLVAERRLIPIIGVNRRSATETTTQPLSRLFKAGLGSNAAPRQGNFAPALMMFGK